MASLAPHAPYQAPQTDVDTYKDLAGDEHQHTLSAIVADLDTQVGRMVERSEEKSMLDNTLIIFSSDNGGATSALFRLERAPRKNVRKAAAWDSKRTSGLQRQPARRQRLAARRRSAGSNYLLLAGQAQAEDCR